MSNKTQRLDLLAALSAVMISFQARANGELSHRIGNGIEAALVSFGSGLIVLIIAAIFSKSIKEGIRNIRSAVAEKELKPWTLFAGMLGGSFVAVQTHIVPLIGVAIYSVASIAGQTAASLVVDRIGLTGGGKKHITTRRIAAALFTVFAVFVSVFDRLDARDVSIVAVLLGCLAGALVGVQRSLNGKINEHSHQSYATSFLNFIMGTTFLVIFLAATLIFGDSEVVPLPAGPWWIYTGGVLGVIYIAMASMIVQHIGVLTFTLFSVGGQLVGSLLIDIFSPTQGVQISIYLVVGIAMTYLGVIVGGVNNSESRKRLTHK
jgi:transporter family-2 protein